MAPDACDSCLRRAFRLRTQRLCFGTGLLRTMHMASKRLLLIGASRGLGFALAEEYLQRGWLIVATERGAGRSRLHELAAGSDGRLEVENVDIVQPEQVDALRK